MIMLSLNSLNVSALEKVFSCSFQASWKQCLIVSRILSSSNSFILSSNEPSFVVKRRFSCRFAMLKIVVLRQLLLYCDSSYFKAFHTNDDCDLPSIYLRYERFLLRILSCKGYLPNSLLARLFVVEMARKSPILHQF